MKPVGISLPLAACHQNPFGPGNNSNLWACNRQAEHLLTKIGISQLTWSSIICGTVFAGNFNEERLPPHVQKFLQKKSPSPWDTYFPGMPSLHPGLSAAKTNTNKPEQFSLQQHDNGSSQTIPPAMTLYCGDWCGCVRLAWRLGV